MTKMYVTSPASTYMLLLHGDGFLADLGGRSEWLQRKLILLTSNT
jgi:hypothetical protein